MATANSRVALGSVLDTIAQTANSVSALVNTTTRGIGMLDAMVVKASTEQKKRHTIAALSFDETLAQDYARESSSLKLKADEFCNQSERHKALFNSAYQEAKLALNPKPSE